MRQVTPLRFVAGAVCLWTAGRVAMLTPDLLTSPAEADTPPPARFVARAPVPANLPPGGGASVGRIGTGQMARPMTPLPAGAKVKRRVALAAADLPPPAGQAFPIQAADAPDAERLRLSPSGIVAVVPGSSPPASAAAPATDARRSRWSGGAYLFHRGDGGGTALASGGQLGGSQAGARVAWAVNADGPPRLALAARVATPLDDARGAEVAAGVDWHPLPGRPLRVSVERRVDVGGAGRDAFSAYAAGGFWRRLGKSGVVDGYAQAGVVGARRRDLFADGAIRAGHRQPIGRGRALTLGGGVWGAAQPGVARLDAGPRAAVSLPLGGTSVTAAAEYRVRVAGDARPGSGLAFTLSSDF